MSFLSNEAYQLIILKKKIYTFFQKFNQDIMSVLSNVGLFVFLGVANNIEF